MPVALIAQACGSGDLATLTVQPDCRLDAMLEVVIPLSHFKLIDAIQAFVVHPKQVFLMNCIICFGVERLPGIGCRFLGGNKISGTLPADWGRSLRTAEL
jgi:hypothetical protein